jgi:hypothetical protein
VDAKFDTTIIWKLKIYSRHQTYFKILTSTLAVLKTGQDAVRLRQYISAHLEIVLLIKSSQYESNAIISLYIEKVKHACLEKCIDHLWSQILRFYFHLDDNYGVEREAHTGEGSLDAPTEYST